VALETHGRAVLRGDEGDQRGPAQGVTPGPRRVRRRFYLSVLFFR